MARRRRRPAKGRCAAKKAKGVKKKPSLSMHDRLKAKAVQLRDRWFAEPGYAKRFAAARRDAHETS